MDENTQISEMEITDEFVFADAKVNVSEIAKKLQELKKETDHGAVLITLNKNKVVGIVTKKEVIDLVASGEDISEKTAEDVMNIDFMEVNKDLTLGNLIPSVSDNYPNAIVVVDSKKHCAGFFSKNDYKDALASMGVYDKAHAPKTRGDWRTRGIAMSSLGNEGEALKCYEKAVESKLDKEKGWTDLAKRLERINKLKDALNCYDKALSINPANEAALAEKANIYSKENEDNLAIQNYKKMLEINPNNVEALMNMGSEQANIGEVEEALKYLDKAETIKGETPELLYRKGNVYNIAKKYEDALECFNKAVSKNDYYEEAWFNKGIILNRMGKDQDALQCLIKILQINPGNESARNALNNYKKQGALKMF